MAGCEIRSVGPYILEGTLGRGQTGLVKLGINCVTKKKVAVKIIDRTKLSEQVLSKVEREIAIMKLIDHPHVLGLYDVYESKKHLFLVLEHVSGGELFDYLVKRGRLPLGEARRFFAQMISAVDFCHKHCVCHRDLKPENLLLDKKMNIKVADFGMASLQVGDNAMLETSCGSPHYACPEVIRGEKYDGRKADVWSCGVILYALLVGALPFDDENLRNLLEKVKRGHFSIPVFIPTDVQEMIKGMINVDPAKRITMEEVKTHSFLNSFKDELPSEPHVVDIVKTEVIPVKDEIDPDVLHSMSSLGCFKNREKLLRNLLKQEKTIEKVIYFMLLDRKERSPSHEDAAVASIKLKEILEDAPRKRVDSCGSPRLQRPRKASLTASPPVTPRTRAETYSGGGVSPLVHVSPKHQPYSQLLQDSSPLSSPPESPTHHATTPPGSPWRSRLATFKHAIVGSPRFHRKKLSQNCVENSPASASPDSSPDIVKRSWFGHLMLGHQNLHPKHEPFFIITREKPFSTVKADVVHAFLSVSHLTHSVLSQNGFKAEYKKPGGKTMFKKAVRISVNICPTDQSKQENLSSVHTISIVLESGPVHRFKKLCEKLQLILLSNTRRSTSNCRADEDNKEERSSADEKRSCSQNSKLQLTQLSDTESEGEVLDSPKVTKKPLANNVNGKSAEKLI
ncbi:Serine/threonine-protein kinase brsk1 [Desmophyllum pertusum]|uniref:non-specific serine/threonine protein kinase n=2 Tax=Scleractinia TaxID=6125 RepID=A0A9X0D8U0_9CNID|nr:Serine/threonine-protein kinase brsk1 [Desmophyllum pertusum]